MKLKKVILASHGDLSKGMLHSIQVIIGKPSCDIETYSLYPGDSAVEYANKLNEEIKLHPNTQYIVIADVLGGSVHTALMQILDNDNLFLYSGMNMSMVLEVLTCFDDTDQE